MMGAFCKMAPGFACVQREPTACGAFMGEALGSDGPQCGHDDLHFGEGDGVDFGCLPPQPGYVCARGAHDIAVCMVSTGPVASVTCPASYEGGLEATLKSRG